MDASVIAAIAKWPNVPAVFGWLGLTARGEWRLRGERIENVAMRAFMDRNYGSDAQGRWFFQNGPQRVFVKLDLTPWVYRVMPGEPLVAHTGAQPRALKGAALLDDGRFVVETDLGAGVIDDRDAALFLRVITDFAGLPLNERGLERWLEGKDEAFVAGALLGLAAAPQRIERVRVGHLAQRYGFVAEPAPEQRSAEPVQRNRFAPPLSFRSEPRRTPAQSAASECIAAPALCARPRNNAGRLTPPRRSVTLTANEVNTS